MARRDESLFVILTELPWWVGVSLAVFVYTASNFVIPTIDFENFVYKAVAQASPTIGKWFSLLFLLSGFISFFRSFFKKKRLDKQTGIHSIRSLGWKQFEELLGEAYRRQGYTVIENSGGGADGGVDLKLKKDGETVLVQCKQWRASRVGVKVVREMFGIMTARKADRVVIVTSVGFTPEAKDFAAGKAIDLVAEQELTQLIGDVQETRNIESVIQIKTGPLCPRCKNRMVLRTVRRGGNVGNKFWGCSMFPKCRGIVNI